jgi:hypothetical protein
MLEQQPTNFAPIVGIFAAVFLVVLFFSFVPVRLWISALASNVRIGIMTLIGMKLRRVRPENIVNPLIKATKAGLSLQTKRLEAHYLAGGNVDRVVNALVAAGFEGYVRPDHGRNIWGEDGKPGYGLFDRALGAAYLNGLFESAEKHLKEKENNK